MRLLGVCLMLGVFSCAGGAQPLLPPVGLYARFQIEPPPAVMESMQEELAALMSPVGIPIQWRSIPETQMGPVEVELAVVRFGGRCETSAAESISARRGPLGLTHAVAGDIQPFSDIDCTRILRAVGPDLVFWKLPERDRIFGRALARVVAHELYHIFAATAEHASAGLGKPAVTARELVSKSFGFSKQSLLELRRGPVYMHLRAAANELKTKETASEYASLLSSR